MAFFNQFSFLLLASGLLFLLVIFLRRRKPSEGSLMAVLALIVGLAFAFVFFRPGEGEPVPNASFQAMIPSETPVLLEFQSPYCVACMAVEPIVRQIELDYADQLEVIRINVLADDVDPLLKRYRFQYTPTFVLLDPKGEELWRAVGTIDPERVSTSLEGMQ